MAFRAFQYDEDIPLYDGFAAEDSCAPVEFFAGERICSPGRTRRRHPVLRAIVLIAFTLGFGAAWVEIPEELRGRILSGIEAARSRAMRPAEKPAVALQAGAAEPQAAAAEPSQAPPLAETREIAAAPAEQAGVPVKAPPPEDTAAETPPAPAPEREPAAPQPLPPPVVDPADPYQKRALAVGLHPELSHAVLSRLTDADYRNARLAIKAALAETPDSKAYAWPKEGGGAKLALFEVHFVPGATPECRRYVVTVTMNHWSTTALPMERCGVKAAGKAGVQ